VTPRLPWSNLHVIKNNTHCWFFFFFFKEGENKEKQLMNYFLFMILTALLVGFNFWKTRLDYLGHDETGKKKTKPEEQRTNSMINNGREVNKKLTYRLFV
jgi:hypothetical protein